MQQQNKRAVSEILALNTDDENELLELLYLGNKKAIQQFRATRKDKQDCPIKQENTNNDNFYVPVQPLPDKLPPKEQWPVVILKQKNQQIGNKYEHFTWILQDQYGKFYLIKNQNKNNPFKFWKYYFERQDNKQWLPANDYELPPQFEFLFNKSIKLSNSKSNIEIPEAQEMPEF